MRRGTTRGRGMLTVVAGAVLVLAGCTATAEPEAEPTGAAVEQSVAPTATSAPTATPTASVAPESIKPERPEAMSRNDTAGAAAAAGYFLSLFAYVFATGDLSDWQELSHPDCTFCTAIVEDVEAMASAGQSSRGGTFRLDTSEARVVTPDTFYAVEIEAVQASSVTVDSAGVILEEFPEEKAIWIDAALVHEEGRWLIREFTPRDAS